MNEFILPSDKPWESAITTMLRFVHALDHSKAHVITVDRLRRERSDLQNRALWGVAYKTLSQETGNEPEDLHTYFCGEYFGWEEFDIMGQPRKRPKRTTTKDERGNRDVVSTEVLSDFYGFIQRRAAETVGIYVPDPDPEWWRKDAAA
jgi:hypothetical protein